MADPSGRSGESGVFGLTVANAMRATISAFVLGGISAGFTYAKTRSVEAAFQAGLNTYGAVFFSVAFPPAGLAIGGAGVVSLGTQVWADGLTAMDAAEIATMFAASFALHASFQRYGPGFPNRAPGDTPVPANTVSTTQAGRMTGLLNYVVTENGELVLGRQRSSRGDAGHIDLAQGKPVLAAGEVKVVGGQIKSINNQSGHYQPSGPIQRVAAIRALKVIDENAGGKYVEKAFEFPPIEIPWGEIMSTTGAGIGQQ